MSNQRARCSSIEGPYILNCPISQYSFSFKIGATSRQTEGMFCISTPLAKEPKGPHGLKEPSLPLIATSKLLNFSFPEPDRGELDHKSFCSIFLSEHDFSSYEFNLYISLYLYVWGVSKYLLATTKLP